MRAHLAIILSVVMLFVPLARATQIQQFDRFDGDDQIRFVDKLIDSVEAASQRDPILLAKVKRFFKEKQPGEAISGMGRFELNLSLARIADMQAAAENPKARRIEVEDVMYVTLYKNGISLPSTFRPAPINFQPQRPLQEPLTREDANKALAQTQAWIARTVEPEHTFSHGGPQSVSGFSDDQKAIAFFAALAVLAMASRSEGGSGGDSPPPAPNPNQWWMDRGYSSLNDALSATCRAAVADSTYKGCD